MHHPQTTINTTTTTTSSSMTFLADTVPLQTQEKPPAATATPKSLGKLPQQRPPALGGPGGRGHTRKPRNKDRKKFANDMAPGSRGGAKRRGNGVPKAANMDRLFSKS
jgi:hypothetical protein